MQVAILQELRVQVSELFTHEFYGSSSCSSTHILDHWHHVRWELSCIVTIFARLLHEVLREYADLWVRHRQHQVHVWFVTELRHSCQALNWQYLLLEHVIFALFLQKLELYIFNGKRQIDTVDIFLGFPIDNRSGISRLEVADPFLEQVLCHLNSTQILLLKVRSLGCHGLRAGRRVALNGRCNLASAGCLAPRYRTWLNHEGISCLRLQCLLIVLWLNKWCLETLSGIFLLN